MAQRLLHGYAWFAYPDSFGMDESDPSSTGHPFATPSGELKLPEEVLFYRRTDPSDLGVKNLQRAESYLVFSKTQHHPRLSGGWESEPAALGDTFKTADGKVRLTKIVQVHHRHSG